MSPVLILLVGLIIFLAHALEGITGFGCTVISLPFISMLLGIKLTIPVLCVLGFLMALYIVCRSWKYLQWREFLFIVLFCGLGLPVGMYLYSYLSPVILSLILACFMVGVGLNGTRSTLKTHRSPESKPAPSVKSWPMKLVLFCGGIIHGAFGTGGPFVVIYAAGALPQKSLFRVTLSLLWLSLNTIRLSIWTVNGTICSADIWKTILWTLPFMVTGVLLGDYLHHKVNDYIFRLCLYCVLTLAGFVMLGSNVCKLLMPA